MKDSETHDAHPRGDSATLARRRRAPRRARLRSRPSRARSASDDGDQGPCTRPTPRTSARCRSAWCCPGPSTTWSPSTPPATRRARRSCPAAGARACRGRPSTTRWSSTSPSTCTPSASPTRSVPWSASSPGRSTRRSTAGPRREGRDGLRPRSLLALALHDRGQHRQQLVRHPLRAVQALRPGPAHLGQRRVAGGRHLRRRALPRRCRRGEAARRDHRRRRAQGRDLRRTCATCATATPT